MCKNLDITLTLNLHTARNLFPLPYIQMPENIKLSAVCQKEYKICILKSAFTDVKLLAFDHSPFKQTFKYRQKQM